jgi:hypothetical protein
LFKSRQKYRTFALPILKQKGESGTFLVLELDCRTGRGMGQVKKGRLKRNKVRVSPDLIRLVQNLYGIDLCAFINASAGVSKPDKRITSR